MATTTSQGPMLYKDWLEQQRALNQQDYDKSVATAGEVLGENRAAVDYNYNRSTTGYGMLAEQLAQSGLSTSGYSDNLTRDAYASRQTGYSDAYKIYSDSVQKAADDKAAADRTLDLEAYQHDQNMREAFLADYETVGEGTMKSTIKNLVSAAGYTKAMADDLFKKAGLTPMTEAEYNAIFGIEGGDNTPVEQTSVSPLFRTYFDTLIANNDSEISAEYLQALFAAVEDSGTAYDKQKLSDILNGPAMQNGMLISGYTSLADYLTRAKGLGTVISGVIENLPASSGESYAPSQQPGQVGTTTTGAAYNLTANGFKISDAPNKLKEGKNFKISYNGSTYRAELGEKVSLSDTANKGLSDASKDAADGTLFYYNGNIYVKYVDDSNNPEIYKVRRRSMFYGESFNDLTSAIKKNALGGNAAQQATYTYEKDDVINGKDVSISVMGNTYSVTSKGEVTNEDVLTAADSVSDGGVFKYGDTAYVRIDGKDADGATVKKVYQLGARSAFPGHYDNLLSSLDDTSTDEQKSASQAGLENASKSVKVVSEDVGGTWDIIGGVGGNNISVKVGDKTYNVETGSRAPDEVVAAAQGADVGQNTVFAYNGKLYFRNKDKYYEIRERKNTGEGGYASLYDAQFDKEGVQGDSYGNAFEVTKVRDGDTFLKFGSQEKTEDYTKNDLVNFKDEYGKVHRLKVEGEVTDVAPPAGVKDDQPFSVNEVIYVKHNGKVYKLKSRAAYGHAYDALLAKLEAMQDK